ncbi:3' terminal RNA ribose 2'-O-methyltransferase Hen1 [Kineococcus sp. G2]|uniref:3' terminal RNA ribose 2'-O-methyltransferase Hen1 n=1 Tax=Kineococcus sp. G2 TaxID=3127484 RepID=UPI00301D1AEB
MIVTLTLDAGAQDLPGGALADDLGFLLHKHPGRVQTFDLAVGTAHVVYPEAGPQRCTAALLLEVDPVELVRSRSASGPRGEASSLAQHVNDRPYAASSLLAVALGRVFRTALTGRCDQRPGLAAAALPLTVRVPALPCRGGADLLRRLAEPLGWAVDARPLPLDETVPAWGASPYVDATLTGRVRLADALRHLYVLLPVLDDAKHYWVGPDEVDKLVRTGGGWLATHPERELIARRYLAHRRALTDDALDRLAELDGGTLAEEIAAQQLAAEPQGDDPETPAPGTGAGAAAEGPVPLARQRREAVLAALRAAGARRVADLGCGQGELLTALLADGTFTEVVGTDVSVRALQAAARRLRLDRADGANPFDPRSRLRLFQSSLTYRDARLAGLDAAVLVEVVEHVDPPRLPALERAVFGEAAPRTVLVTTPNVEHNVRYPHLTAEGFRHRDHRFELTRAQFREWAEEVGRRYGYAVRISGVGAQDPEVGAPSQLAEFTRVATSGEGAA